MKGIEGGSGHPSQKRNPFFLKGNKQTKILLNLYVTKKIFSSFLGIPLD